MKEQRYSLGLDLSTQSLSAVVIDVATRETEAELSLDYRNDPRLAVYALREGTYILSPRIDGEADQPPLLFLAALDALFSDLKKLIDISRIADINVSAQQHGHVYLGDTAAVSFAALRESGTADSDLTTLLGGCFSYGRVPIWMSTHTAEEASFLREQAGGRKTLIELSGSDAQLRFTGTIIRNVANRFPVAYQQTKTIQLLSNFLPGVLTGNHRAPADYGNACGTSLMNYREKKWDERLISAVAKGLPGEGLELQAKLPELMKPDAIVGKPCTYFIDKYGFSSECAVVAGSGDNPQSKVLVPGELLSLGSSIVIMAATDGQTLDLSGASSAMYDGVGRPFSFGCRTNGVLVWDSVRAEYGLNKQEYETADRALTDTLPGANLVLWQPRTESFPISGTFDKWCDEDTDLGLAPDYAGIIESSLAAVYCHSRVFSQASDEQLYVTGGATGSPGIMRRIAAIWNKPVVPHKAAGAALGAAVAGISALFQSEGRLLTVEAIAQDLVTTEKLILPTPADVAAFHGPGGYLECFLEIERKLIADHPL